MENKLPGEMFAPVNQFGVRTDRNERFELHCGVYEFLATPEYHLRPNLVIPHFLLAIEMTYFTVSQGIFSQVLSSLQADTPLTMLFVMDVTNTSLVFVTSASIAQIGTFVIHALSLLTSFTPITFLYPSTNLSALLIL